jgi:uncharacterized protein (DUF58 family)
VTGRTALGLALGLGGSLLAVPLVVVLGLAIVLHDAVHGVWRRRGLEAVEYERTFGTPRAVVGDVVPLDVSVWNRKRLPLAWLRAEDRAAVGLEVQERTLVLADEWGRVLENAWTLAPYERVVRHFHVRAARRGVHELGPVRLSVGDLFAGTADERELGSVVRLVVRPRTVAVSGLDPSTRWGGDERARRGFIDQPLSYAGVREYQAGDPIRRLHHRTSARLGRPVVKRFDPSRERAILLALDLQTLDGPAWQPTYDDDRVEDLCVVVGSLARALRAEGAAVGLAVAGYAGAPRPVAVLPPAERAEQVGRILDLLARLSPFPSTTFERLLSGLPRLLRPGAEIIVVTARDPGPYLASMRRLRSIGYGVTLLGVGPRAAFAVGRARSAGVASRVVRLDGTWADAAGLVVA